MKIKTIDSEGEHKSALEVLEALMKSPLSDSNHSEEISSLVEVIEAYENKHYSITPATAIDAIKFRMNEKGLSPEDLVPAIGDVECVKEILNGSLRLTITMAQQLHTQFGIPLASLIRM